MPSGGKNFKDLTGMQFGKLTVLNFVEMKNKKSYWLCQCNCKDKTIIKVVAANLKNGNTKSCGCSHIKDLIGKTFNKLTVIEFAYLKNHSSYWYCKCNCESKKIVIVRGAQLTNGVTKSCGCLVKENNARRLNPGESAFNQLYRSYRYHALKRDLSFDLTKIEFKYIIDGNCFYCGCKPLQISSTKKTNGTYIYNGIDRIDNNEGYKLSNCVSCCKNCNIAKNNLSQFEFKNLIINIYNYWIILETQGDK
ncbi:MAG TPA: hypothetical protein DDY71_05630 [Spirochaetia bacterium]|nr:hypothetical protein [Spirochaetia bacterium]